LNNLVDVSGKILIPGIYDQVAPVTQQEKDLYAAMDFDEDDFRSDTGAHAFSKASKEEILMSRWRHPSLSIHGVEGAFSGSGAKTVIPAKVVGKFSIRIVPNQEPEEVERLVKEYIEKLHKARGSKNVCKFVPYHNGKWWISDFNHPHYTAGRAAIKRVFGVEPDLTREGGSIPVTLTFQEITGKNVMLLPIGACDDMAHSQNEKLDIVNYIQGTKLLGAYFYEVAALK